MRTTLLTAALACAVALPVPAHAGEPVYGCGFETLAQDATGSGYSLLAYGYVAHPGSDVTITCFIRVDGIEQSRTTTGTGPSVAVTTGPVRFEATADSVVEGCALATVDGQEHLRCFTGQSIEIPPREVVDVIDDAYDLTYALDPVLCPVLGGDVYVADELGWDCPPYEG